MRRAAQKCGPREEGDPTIREFSFKILADLLLLCRNLSTALEELGADVPDDDEGHGAIDLEKLQDPDTTPPITAKELDELCRSTSLRVGRLTDACDAASQRAPGTSSDGRRSRRLENAERTLEAMRVELQAAERGNVDDGPH